MRPTWSNEAETHTGTGRPACQSLAELMLQFGAEFYISTAKSRSAILSLDVRHSSFAFITASLGTVSVKIGDLLDKCEDNKGAYNCRALSSY